MIVVMKKNCRAEEIYQLMARIKEDGYAVHLSEGEERTILGVVGHSPTPLREENYSTMAGVEKVLRITAKYKLASLDFREKDSLVPVNGQFMGGDKVLVVAGPCAVESRQQIIETAHAVKEAGATGLRGGAYKPRTSPYSFQGHGEKGLQWLAEAREETGLPIFTEVMSSELVPIVAQYADVLQIGARNMQNFHLLNACGASQQTVLIKRGMSSTLEDLLMAAEYVLSNGNNRVILCERGIRTYETATRNTFDLSAIPVLKQMTHLPIVADPSHATGKWELVEPVARGAVAAGADGLLLEVHMQPEVALSDGRQSLTPKRFQQLMENVQRVAEAVGRSA